MVQKLPAAIVPPLTQADGEELSTVVPTGKLGKLRANPVAGSLPLLLMMICRGWPEGCPFKLSPAMLSVKSEVLLLLFKIALVGLVTRVIAKLSAGLGR
jgi:hypothetical protein